MITIPIIPTTSSNIDDTKSKDWAAVKSMMAYARKVPQHNLTKINLNTAPKKTKITMIMLPPWGTFFPPYNLARLAGLTSAEGYETSVYDINVVAWKRLSKNSTVDFWDRAKEWMWQGKQYTKDIHPLLEDTLNEYIEKIVQDKPDVVGFSLYYTNEAPSNWMTLKLKKLLPDTKIIVGGPQALTPNPITKQLYDHIVQGEGEQVILDLLNKIENNKSINQKILPANSDRLDLDSLPFPDYSYFDLNDYQIPNAISSEFTRGCVAKCSFCTETHFWKYRGRMARTVLDEVKHQFERYGSDHIWFIDSLLNGNLNELRAFSLGIAESKLPITWQGNARCNGRMDLEYFKDLFNGGCRHLIFGVESGSQLVLNSIRKNISIDEIEQNLKHAHQSNIKVTTNWITGFPSEDLQGFNDTLTLISRLAEYHGQGSCYCAGVSLSLAEGSEIASNKEKFNIDPLESFEDSWTTKDLTNTKVHRLIRQKSLVLLLQELSKRINFTSDVVDTIPLSQSYSITYQENITRTIPYEIFDYNLIKFDNSEFSNSVVNQIWPLLRILWRIFGAYEIEITFDPKFDLTGFGYRLSCDYFAKHKFSIATSGQWTADFSYRFSHSIGKYKNTDYGFLYDWQGSGEWKL